MTGGADLDKKKTFKQGTQIRLDEEPGGGAFHAEPGKGRKGLQSTGRGRPRPRLHPAEEVRGDEAERVGRGWTTQEGDSRWRSSAPQGTLGSAWRHIWLSEP